jgi:hypothetical protein
MTSRSLPETFGAASPPAPPRGRRPRFVGAVLTLMLAATAAFAPSASAAEPWGFEQVTPVDKGAGSVHPIDTFRPSPDGNGFLLSATSSFDGVPAESAPLYTRYFASRGADGWSNRPLDPPIDPIPPNDISAVMSVLGSSADLSHVMVASTRALTPGATEGGGNLYMRNTATGAYTLVATDEDTIFARQFVMNAGVEYVKYVGNGGRSALFGSIVSLLPGAPDGRHTGQESALYGWTAEEGLRVMSVMPSSEGGGTPSIGGAVASSPESGIRGSVPDSDGLDHVYFQTKNGGGPGPVYVRSGGETRVVSVSRIPDASSDPVDVRIEATGRGGLFMLFSTVQATPLTSDTPTDLDASQFMYRYDVANDSLVYVGALMAPMKPVIQMSQDGRTVAFLSRLGLTSDAPAYEFGQEENIYVWRDGALRFVGRADADSTPLVDTEYLRVLSSNGRYLAFTDNSTGSQSPATKAGATLGSATADCPHPQTASPAVCGQVFVFDADADELKCASCRPDGVAPNGAAGDPGVRSAGMVRMDYRQKQTVADDGTVFFTTPGDLVERDSNGLNDVYAYRDGQHRLLSRAAQGMKARFLDATPDGRSVFLATNDPIAPTDNDKAVDVYMTREGAGFPYTPPIVVPPCTGSDCRGPFTPVADLPLAGSVSFDGRGNAGLAPARLAVAGRKSIVGVAGKLRVRVPGRGRVTVSGAGVKTAKRQVSRAGTYTVRVVLTAKARKALKRSKSRSARKRVRVTFTPAQGSASQRTLSLTYKSKPANKKKGR